jgi:hypothetical protein
LQQEKTGMQAIQFLFKVISNTPGWEKYRIQGRMDYGATE